MERFYPLCEEPIECEEEPGYFEVRRETAKGPILGEVKPGITVEEFLSRFGAGAFHFIAKSTKHRIIKHFDNSFEMLTPPPLPAPPAPPAPPASASMNMEELIERVIEKRFAALERALQGAPAPAPALPGDYMQHMMKTAFDEAAASRTQLLNFMYEKLNRRDEPPAPAPVPSSSSSNPLDSALEGLRKLKEFKGLMGELGFDGDDVNPDSPAVEIMKTLSPNLKELINLGREYLLRKKPIEDGEEEDDQEGEEEEDEGTMNKRAILAMVREYSEATASAMVFDKVRAGTIPLAAIENPKLIFDFLGIAENSEDGTKVKSIIERVSKLLKAKKKPS